MLRQKILDLFGECDPEVQDVIAHVLDAEWARLSMKKPPGIVEEIRQIINEKVELSEYET